MTTTIEQSQLVTLTSQAAENISSLLEEKNLQGHCLRVYVAGIGCSGPQYGLAFDENPRENDAVFETDGVKMVIDENSLTYLEGATIDFVESPQGAGFKIENPNPLAMAACGSCSGSCG